MEQDIRFCKTLDGVRLAYATSGKGDPPLVRVLGWFTHLEYEWENALWRTPIDPSGPKTTSSSATTAAAWASPTAACASLASRSL
jgi:hypothetical protein